MTSKKIEKIIILAAVDAAIAVFSDLFPLILRFGLFDMDTGGYLDLVIRYLPADMLIVIISMAIFRLYNRVWTFAGLDELIACVLASGLSEALILAYHMIFDIRMPRSFYILNLLSLLILLPASRLSLRVYRQITGRHRGSDMRRVMLVGAGSAASILIRDLMYGPGDSRVVCAIDDNPAKKGKYISGIPIVGNRYDIPRAVSKYGIDEIIITMPSAPPSDTREIIEICQKTDAKVKRLPSIAKSVTENLLGTVRDINYEDLLERDEVVIKDPGLSDFIKGKTILVTGGGGSIGSELCRQIAANGPGKLIIADIYENGAYELQMELKRHSPDTDVEVVIGSVRDYDRMEDIFRTYRPDIVYHAAAHKHVPLMEASPCEAVKNNCLGTLNLVRLSDIYGVYRFILISTDKAVRPTSVMGATKRICEMIIQAYDRHSAHTRYAAVRFGNVLGSSGSVVPLFLKEIEDGGPVTLTDRNITRYFMTIREAVFLILQAGLMAGGGGEIFVLDMGEPVKIYDLAEKLIRLKGLIPGKDIEIKEVGLRPGEKLYEELLMAEEGLKSTDNRLIYTGRPIEMDDEEFFGKLSHLIEAAERNDPDIRAKISEICGTYTGGGTVA